MEGNLIIDGEKQQLMSMPILPLKGSQCPVEDPQPQCAASAMMHGPSMAAASSWQGGCPTIARTPRDGSLQCRASMRYGPTQDTRSRPTSGTYMFRRVLAVQDLLHLSFVIATLRRVHTFQAMEEVDHNQSTTLSIFDRNASMENLRELQKYSEKLQLVATCCRPWSNGILDQIMDEQENRLQGIRPWHLHHAMHRFQVEWELIHGAKHGRGISTSE